MSCLQLTQKWFVMSCVCSSTRWWRLLFKSLAHLTESLWLKASSHLRCAESIVADPAVSGDVSWCCISLQCLKPGSVCDVFPLQLCATFAETLCETLREWCVFTSCEWCRFTCVAAELTVVSTSYKHHSHMIMTAPKISGKVTDSKILVKFSKFLSRLLQLVIHDW